jgi:hypothetical protein
MKEFTGFEAAASWKRTARGQAEVVISSDSPGARLPTDLRTRSVRLTDARSEELMNTGGRLSAFRSDVTAAIADKYPFGRMQSRTAMVGQMLHLRAAAGADAGGDFLCIGGTFEHR